MLPEWSTQEIAIWGSQPVVNRMLTVLLPGLSILIMGTNGSI